MQNCHWGKEGTPHKPGQPYALRLGGESIWVKPCTAQAAEANNLPGGGSTPAPVTETRMLLQKVLEQGACQ